MVETKTKAKSNGNTKAIEKSVKNRDQYLRSSFLYQAAILMSNGPANSKRDVKMAPLGRLYASQSKAVARKNVIRLSPDIKRTICKQCNTIMLPGSLCQIDIINESRNKTKKHADVLIYTCRECHSQKRYPIGKNREYMVFTDDRRQEITRIELGVNAALNN
ncbi:RNAse P Rpr2/Rpp21/SNM1 subunit domain-containing protein [Dipodascopsis uninucleata]